MIAAGFTSLLIASDRPTTTGPFLTGVVERIDAFATLFCTGFFKSLVDAQLLLAPNQTSASDGKEGSTVVLATEVWVTFMDRAPYCELALDTWAAEAGLAKQREPVPFSGGAFGLYKHRMTRYDRVVKADAASSCHVYVLAP